jgi:hypothetical protein
MEKKEGRIQIIENQLELIKDRVCEIKGEITTLDFQMELSKLDARLYRMKRKTFMYELELLDKKVGELNAEFDILNLFKEIGIEVEEHSDEEEKVNK